MGITEDKPLWAFHVDYCAHKVLALLFNMIKLPKLTGGPAVLVGSFSIQNLLRLVSNLILTRLLFPEAFGLMAIVGSVMFVVELSSDMGFKAFLIRHEHGDEPRYLDTVWSIKVIRGAVLGLCLVALAYPISRFYESAQLFPILVLTALTFFIRGLESISLILAERDQRLVKLSLIELSAFVAQMIVTIALAYYLRNVWSLVFGALFGVSLLVGLGYLLFENSIRVFRIDRVVLSEAWAFAKVIMASSILTIVITQFDTFFIGKFLGLQLLGVYAIAFNLAYAFVQLFQTVSTRVVFPRFSKANRQSAEKLAISFREERQKFVPYFLFAGGAFLMMGDLVFQILFDPRYHEGGVYFSLLMVRPILMALALPAEHCLIAVGRVRVALISNIFRTVWLLAGVSLGYSMLGIYGVILAVATTDIIPLVYLWRELGKIMPVNLRFEAISILFILAGLAVGWVLKTLIISSGLVDALIEF